MHYFIFKKLFVLNTVNERCNNLVLNENKISFNTVQTDIVRVWCIRLLRNSAKNLPFFKQLSIGPKTYTILLSGISNFIRRNSAAFFGENSPFAVICRQHIKNIHTRLLTVSGVQRAFKNETIFIWNFLNIWNGNQNQNLNSTKNIIRTRT